MYKILMIDFLTCSWYHWSMDNEMGKALPAINEL